MFPVALTETVHNRSDAADDALVARARRGDAEAFGALVAARLPDMLRLARSILGNEADARDATQEAFVSAWLNLPRLRDDSHFSAWLNTVLANRCRDLLRKRGRVREITLEGADLQRADPGPAALERAAVLAAFDRLSVADRQILAMHHLLDQPLEQVAHRLGIPVGTAKSRLHAARKSLERALETQA
jgi:RNA polymerase sigma-70 factor, ECF subfamily